MTSNLRRRISWMALWAVMFAALAPAISHWVAARTGQAWGEICSAAGIQRVAIDQDSKPSPSGGHEFESGHCPFCRVQDHLPVLLTPVFALVVLSAIRRCALSAPLSQPPRAISFWAPALSRAPPSLS
ncbi:MAG TPA: DUF2946 domain-containing protein [Usitatibacter sp.]|nr:DUF2946 domain-containing protein [Usitatibacter sp.]